LEMATHFSTSLEKRKMMSTELAPKTLRIPISLVHRITATAVSPKSPIAAMIRANPVVGNCSLIVLRPTQLRQYKKVKPIYQVK